MSQKRVLICSPLIPEFDRERGSQRLFNIAKLFISRGWKVVYYARNTMDGMRYIQLLQEMGVMVFGGEHSRWLPISKYVQGVDEILESIHFDLAFIAFWKLAEDLIPTIRATSPQTKIMVDSIDIHFLRHARQNFLDMQHVSNVAHNVLDNTYADEMRREMNTYAQADRVLTVSEKEAQLVNDFLGYTHAASVPLMEDLTPSTVPFENRKGILFIGNFRHPPNVDAVKFLLVSVAPHIPPNLLEEHPISIVGNALSDMVLAFRQDEQPVQMVGWVPEVEPYLNHARVSVAPLRYGAGSKGKIISSLASGTPMVTTSIGLEGFALQHESHLLVADDPKAFANHITNLLQDATLWHHLQQQGREVIVQLHGKQKFEADMDTAVQGIGLNL